MQQPEAVERFNESIDDLITNLTVLKNEIMAVNNAVRAGNLTENTLAENDEIYKLSEIQSCNRKIKNKLDRFSKVSMIADAFQKINNCADFKKYDINAGSPKIRSYYGKSYSMIVDYKFKKGNTEVELEVAIGLNYQNSVNVGIHKAGGGCLNLQSIPAPGFAFNYAGQKKVNVKTFCNKIATIQADILTAYSYIMSLPAPT